MSPVLVEIGALLRATPGPDAPAVVVAAWYERKAELFEHVARWEYGPEAKDAAALAEQAHRHANELLAEVA